MAYSDLSIPYITKSYEFFVSYISYITMLVKPNKNTLKTVLLFINFTEI